MTGISTDFQQNPRYQRVIQRLNAMSPENRKSLNAALADKAFTTADLRHKMRLADLGASKLSAKRNLETGQERLQLGRKSLKNRKKAAGRAWLERRKLRKGAETRGKYADIISGVNLLGSTWLGHQKRKQTRDPEPTGVDNSFYKYRMAVK